MLTQPAKVCSCCRPGAFKTSRRPLRHAYGACICEFVRAVLFPESAEDVDIMRWLPPIMFCNPGGRIGPG
jgi:hypothetical protein